MNFNINKKNKKNLFLYFVLIFSIFITGCSKNLVENFTGNNNIEEVEQVNGDYQVSLEFPFDIDDLDSSLVTNQLHSFIGYEDQGTLLVKSKNFDNYEILINNNKITTDSIENSEDWFSVDISTMTLNGDNRLQVSQTNSNPEDSLEIKIPYPVLFDGTEEYVDNDNFKMIDQIIQSEIDNGFTSAQLVVTKNGKIIKSDSYGLVNSYNQDGTDLEDSAEVTDETLYDLASNTKMYSANYAIQKLVSEEKLNVDQKISDILPEFKDNEEDEIKGKDDLMVKDLLQHHAGFPSSYHYHNRDFDLDAEDRSSPNGNELYTQGNRDEHREMVLKTPLVNEPGTVQQYTDVDYMLLTYIIEEVAGQNLDKYMDEEFYEPLKLVNTTFNPLEKGFEKDQIAATELNGNTRDGVNDFDNMRKETLQGEVHDEKAYYSMDGISGHAGLFSTANDLAVLTQITLNKGGYGEHKFFDIDVMEEFITPKNDDPSYGLGWRRKGEDTYNFAFSPISNSNTIGHTGWTGTLTVIDPVNNMSVILLTNRKNSPVIDNEENANDFVGDHFLTAHYGLVSTFAFDYQENNIDSNDKKLIDMINSKYQLIHENKDYAVEVDKAQLQSMIVVLENRNSDIIKEYMETETWETINTFLSSDN